MLSGFGGGVTVRKPSRSAPGADAPCAGGVRTRRWGPAKGGRCESGSGVEGYRPDRE